METSRTAEPPVAIEVLLEGLLTAKAPVAQVTCKTKNGDRISNIARGRNWARWIERLEGNSIVVNHVQEGARGQL